MSLFLLRFDATFLTYSDLFWQFFCDRHDMPWPNRPCPTQVEVDKAEQVAEPLLSFAEAIGERLKRWISWMQPGDTQQSQHTSNIC
jgi:hypothetical protein